MTSPQPAWTLQQINDLFALPFNDLLFRAHSCHRENFDPNEVQVSTLMSIKTGACPEDCKYCPQSGHYSTGLQKEKLQALEQVVQQAKAAKAAGASRFCMGAAWRSPTDKAMPEVVAMIREVKALGMETCMTLGQLDADQAQTLAAAGLDYYNHNLDTSPEFYPEIITTRSYADRLNTLQQVRQAGMKVCCGGIVGMGEEVKDRAALLLQLSQLDPQPESVPINMLVKVAGTPLEAVEDLPALEFIRVVAVARLVLPKSRIRLSAGREQLDSAHQALAFFAGANSIFYGDRLLTTSNPQATEDQQLFARLGINASSQQVPVNDEVRQAALTAAVEQQTSLFQDATQPRGGQTRTPCGLTL